MLAAAGHGKDVGFIGLKVGPPNPTFTSLSCAWIAVLSLVVLHMVFPIPLHISLATMGAGKNRNKQCLQIVRLQNVHDPANPGFFLKQ